MRPNQYLKHLNKTQTTGWLVQFGCVNNKWLVNKFFNDTKYKNPRTAAVKFRNAEIKRLDYPIDGRAKSIKSETNIPGLSIAESQLRDGIAFYWQASFRGNRQWFSIKRYGYSSAFQKALLCRKEQAGEKYYWRKPPAPIRPELIEWLETI